MGVRFPQGHPKGQGNNERAGSLDPCRMRDGSPIRSRKTAMDNLPWANRVLLSAGPAQWIGENRIHRPTAWITPLGKPGRRRTPRVGRRSSIKQVNKIRYVSNQVIANFLQTWRIGITDYVALGNILRKPSQQ